MQHDLEKRLEKIIIPPETNISDAISKLDKAGLGVLLLCKNERQLIGVLTDGDIRRAILQDISFDKPCISIASRDPVVAHQGITELEALEYMDHAKDFIVDHLPVIEDEGKVVDLLLRRDLVKPENIDLSAVIMAGGYGKRLRPLTEETPKPLLKIGNRPIMEVIIEQLKDSGIEQVNVTTHYLADKIKRHFEDGHKFGVEINYVNEENPLGTAGALGLIDALEKPILVINGDVLTRVDFNSMFSFHKRHRADITIGVRQYGIEVPYGVVECEGLRVRQLREKPKYNFLVNGGIYIIDPSVHKYIPSEKKFDMTDLIEILLDNKKRVISFPIVEYWLDIGEPLDYEKAKEDFNTWEE